jgi:ubiquinone/menaquinone biosynthesis C-methylase UbiE
MPGVLQRFLAANRRLSERFAPRLESTDRFYRDYDALVIEAARSLPRGAAIVDLGGGRHCPFASEIDRGDGTRIIAVDISEEELRANRSVDEVRVAAGGGGLAFGGGEVPLVTSRTLLEHVRGVPSAVENIGRVTAPGGRSIHLVPCRNSLFALAARVVPWRVAKRVLDRLVPSAKGVVEFEPFYDHCEPRTLRRLFEDAGFDEVRVTVCWSQADYFQSLFPVFLAAWGYQALLRRFGVERLAAYAIVDARR